MKPRNQIQWILVVSDIASIGLDIEERDIAMKNKQKFHTFVNPKVRSDAHMATLVTYVDHT